MIYDWYKVINKAEFEATGLVSRSVQLILEGVGLADILVTKGKLVSITYAGVMLSIGVTEANPFEFEDLAVYLDASNDIWLGIPNQ